MPQPTHEQGGIPFFSEDDLETFVAHALILTEYDILRNDEDDLLFHLPCLLDGPDNEAVFHYNGGEHGLLWKTDDAMVVCTCIHPEIRKLLDEQIVVYVGEGERAVGEEDLIYPAKIIRTPNTDLVIGEVLARLADAPGRERTKASMGKAPEKENLLLPTPPPQENPLLPTPPQKRKILSTRELLQPLEDEPQTEDEQQPSDMETSPDDTAPEEGRTGFRFGNLLRDDPHEEAVQAILGECRQMAGAEPFKAYLEEWGRMRPLLRPLRKSPECPVEHLLFAIDPGCGCTKALNLLSRLMAVDGPFGGEPGDYGDWHCGEQWLPDEYTGVSDLDIDTKQFADGFADEQPGVLGLHMEHWLEKLHTPQFTRILEGCAVLRHRIQFVFIIPFVDQGVITRVYNRLSDQLNVRIIPFPPHSDEALIQVARERFRQYGFAWDKTADAGFARRLRAERHDLRFYGIRTAHKLVTELLLEKLRHQAGTLEKPAALLDKSGHAAPVVAIGDSGAPCLGMLTSADFEEEPSALALGTPTGFERLDALEGLQSIKRRLREIVGALRLQRAAWERGETREAPCLHMLFTGPPGTGKTEVARILGQILREENLLPQGDLVEATRFDMVGQYIGQTGPKTIQLCRSAYGSILFLDEAYLLAAGNGDGDNGDFGREALGALIAEMENQRGRLMVILAGYREEMEDLFRMNPGLRDRIPHQLHFEPYDRDVLSRIAVRQLRHAQAVDDGAIALLEAHFRSIPGTRLLQRDFGNVRYVRNLTERIRMKAMLRRGRNQDAQRTDTQTAGSPRQPEARLPDIQPIDVESALAELQEQADGMSAPVRRFGF